MKVHLLFERLIGCPRQILVLVTLLSMPLALPAQGTQSAKASSSDSPSKGDIFLGYSYLAPNGTVTTTDFSGNPLSGSYKAVNGGLLFSGSYFYNRNLGVQAEFRENKGGSNDGFLTLGGGMVFRFPMEDLTPFVHALLNVAQVNGPNLESNQWGPGLTAGGGMDYDTPWFNHRLALRLFQADYEYMHVNWGPGPYGGRANIDAARLSGGVVFHVGSIAPPPPVTVECPANPTTVYPGDPVTLIANAGGLDPKDHAIYSWSGAGASGADTTVRLDTSSLAPGQYTVSCTVKEGKPGKEGLKPWETANSTGQFKVKAFEPPTINCSANPSSINPGDSATITASGASPQNRPLNYSYTTPAGTVTGSGATATFNSAGAPPGTANITCNVSDDKGNAASSTAMVNVVAPPPPPPAPSPEQKRLEARLALHSVFFPTAQPRAEHPEGGLVESQQATLTSLASDFKNYLTMKPDAHLVLTGHTDPRGPVDYNQSLSERRVNRAKQFLTEQGVPESDIDTQAVGKEQQLTTDQVKALVQENPDLSDADKTKVLRKLSVIVLAQNRRVDISLSTTGQQSVQLYPFNAADSVTLLSEKPPAPKKKAAEKKP